MIKVIFMDYTGTMVQEDEPYTRELLRYFVTHSDLKDPKEILKIVWGKVKETEAACYGDAFVKIDERTDRILKYCVENCGLKGDLSYMHDVWSKIWVHAPLFDDVKPFFERSGLPIYVLSNDDLCYLEESMKLKDLHPAGIISSEMARACKPDRAIFEKALEIAGVKPDEAVLIGDSIVSDVEPAIRLGITPVYLSRMKDVKLEGVRVARSLDDIDPTAI
ncbi:MAG: HAD family hydrolase [Lachnospiraceae bacterium]|nr:HAD family hydrolase [Lachnospiraceae bacterium]